ncbi:MAG: hypothetical protein H6670_09790 [Anaerolineaceae bacterium]|nr:hypothetical protein [Anaerolineaceae bacterium]
MKFPMERVTWIVLVIAFIIFWLICLASSLGLYSFAFLSTMPIPTTLQISRGTALVSNDDVTERGYRFETSLPTRPAVVNNDSQSQSLLVFESADPERGPLAILTLQANSEIRLVSAEQPRYGWTILDAQIVLDSFEGELDVFVFDKSNELGDIRIFDKLGNHVDILGIGRYVVTSANDRMFIDTRDGQALMFATDNRSAVSVTSGQQFRVGGGITDPSPVTTYRDNLIYEGLFSFIKPSIVEDALHLPYPWGCEYRQDSLPSSTATIDYWDTRQAVRYTRGNGAESHGETNCSQSFGPDGISLDDYNFLELETTVLINYQSLSKCGQQGSECPLMLRLRFQTSDGASREWIQGLYYADDPQRDYPSQCSGCTQPNLQINEKVWYTFRSGNLMTLLPATAGFTPTSIQDIKFYASGHDYDVFISELGLYRGWVDVIPQVSQSD